MARRRLFIKTYPETSINSSAYNVALWPVQRASPPLQEGTGPVPLLHVDPARCLLWPTLAEGLGAVPRAAQQQNVTTPHTVTSCSSYGCFVSGSAWDAGAPLWDKSLSPCPRELAVQHLPYHHKGYDSGNAPGTFFPKRSSFTGRGSA